MAEVWLYVVAANSDPNYVRDCSVPWKVDDQLIFFGPCKKRMREKLRSKLLASGKTHCSVPEDLIIVGINGANGNTSRKIVWAGRLSEVMTFEEADRQMMGPRFEELRRDDSSPLHVRQIIQSGLFVGYEHVKSLHAERDAWVSDLVSPSQMKNVTIQGRRVLLPQGSTREAFDRDCCMFLKNLFFAQGQGIDLDKESLVILKEAQPKAIDVDGNAPFGRNSKRAVNGLRGWYLPMTDDLADRFISWLQDRAGQTKARSGGPIGGATKKNCC